MNGRTDLPTTVELGISAELWNALAHRVTERTNHRALFSTRDRAARIAVMALDAAVDEWLVGYARNAEIYPRRYDEVKRALFGTAIPDPAQGVLL